MGMHKRATEQGAAINSTLRSLLHPQLARRCPVGSTVPVASNADYKFIPTANPQPKDTATPMRTPNHMATRFEITKTNCC